MSKNIRICCWQWANCCVKQIYIYLKIRPLLKVFKTTSLLMIFHKKELIIFVFIKCTSLPGFNQKKTPEMQQFIWDSFKEYDDVINTPSHLLYFIAMEMHLLYAVILDWNIYIRITKSDTCINHYNYRPLDNQYLCNYLTDRYNTG